MTFVAMPSNPPLSVTVSVRVIAWGVDCLAGAVQSVVDPVAGEKTPRFAGSVLQL